MSKVRFTPILIALVTGLMLSIPATFHYLFIESNGGMALAGLLAAIYSFVMIVLLIIERVIISQIKWNQKKVWVIETILICFICFAYIFREPTYYFSVDDRIEWFGVLYNNIKSDRKAEYSFPNNKTLRIDKNEILFIDRHDIGKKTTDIKTSGKKWEGYQSVARSFEVAGKEIVCVLYSPSDHELSELELKQVEAILNEKLK